MRVLVAAHRKSEVAVVSRVLENVLRFELGLAHKPALVHANQTIADRQSALLSRRSCARQRQCIRQYTKTSTLFPATRLTAENRGDKAATQS